jgi:hypothetical protein
MSESTQIQTQIQSKSNINSNVKIIEVSKKTYNVIRSVVESSLNPKYEWNKPIIVSENMVKFVKYKFLPNGLEVKAWEVVVQPLIIQKENSELDADLVTVNGGLVKLIVRHEFLAYEDKKVYTVKIMSKPDNIEVNADSIHEFEYYIVSPSEPVPYARPISLADFVNKLMFYYHKAMGAIYNADASEAKQI